MCALSSWVVVPILLIGTMKDLRTKKDLLVLENDAMQVPKVDAHAKASKINAYGYLECSAMWNDGVLEVFKMAAKAILEEEKTTKCCLLI